MQYYVISIFVFISLLCTGFASWVTVGFTVGGSASGSSFGAYQSINTEDYVQLKEVKCFDYCEIGFVVSGVLSNTATVTVTYSFDGAAINGKYGTNYSLQFTLYGLKADGSPLTLFSTNYLTEYTITVGGGDVTASPEARNNNNLVLTVSGTNLPATNDQTLIVTYTFKQTNGSAFTENVYSQIKPATSGATSSFNAYVKLLAN